MKKGTGFLPGPVSFCVKELSQIFRVFLSPPAFEITRDARSSLCVVCEHFMPAVCAHLRALLPAHPAGPPSRYRIFRFFPPVKCRNPGNPPRSSQIPDFPRCSPVIQASGCAGTGRSRMNTGEIPGKSQGNPREIPGKSQGKPFEILLASGMGTIADIPEILYHQFTLPGEPEACRIQ